MNYYWTMKKLPTQSPLYIFLSLVLLILGCNKRSGSPSEVVSDQTIDSPQIIAYYSGDDERINSYDLTGLDQLIYSFLHLKGNKLAIDNTEDSITLMYLTGLKSEYPELKVLISLGGWTGCKTCSDVFNTAEGQREFVASTVKIIEDYDADGIDLDWEYPAIEGPPGHPFRPEDRDNFTNLVQGLREAMQPGDILSFAAGGFPEYLETSIDWTSAMPFIDNVNVMSYDLVGGYSKVTGHHTPLYSTNVQYRSTDQAVTWLLEAGVPASKIVIGAAFYGRIWEDVPAENDGLYQSGNFKRGVDQNNFQEITNGFEFHWDSAAMAPYAYRSADSLFLTYDNKESVALKCRYVIDHNLGGIMFWELLNDKSEDGLLGVMRVSIKDQE